MTKVTNQITIFSYTQDYNICVGWIKCTVKTIQK